jgi:hypothetical protein
MHAGMIPLILRRPPHAIDYQNLHLTSLSLQSEPQLSLQRCK